MERRRGKDEKENGLLGDGKCTEKCCVKNCSINTFLILLLYFINCSIFFGAVYTSIVVIKVMMLISVTQTIRFM